MNLVLDEEVNQGNKSAEEGAGQIFAVFDGLRVGRTQSQTSQCPWQSGDQVADHENVVPVMIVGTGHVGPSTTRQCPEDSHSCNKLGQTATRAVGQAVPQKDQRKSRARANGNKDLEDGSFGVAISDGSADGRKPFDGIAKVLVLDDFMVVQPDAYDQGPQERGIGRDSMGVGDPLAGNLDVLAGQLHVQYACVSGELRARGAACMHTYHGYDVAVAVFGRHID